MTNNLFSSFIYILILVSSWSIVEISVDMLTDNRLYKIIVFAVILLISCLVYSFGLKRKIDFRKVINNRQEQSDLQTDLQSDLENNLIHPVL